MIEVKVFIKASLIKEQVFCESSWHSRPSCAPPVPRLLVAQTEAQMVQHSTHQTSREESPASQKIPTGSCTAKDEGGEKRTSCALLTPTGPPQIPAVWSRCDRDGARGGPGCCWGASTAGASVSSHCPTRCSACEASFWPHTFSGRPEVPASRDRQALGALPALLLPRIPPPRGDKFTETVWVAFIFIFFVTG